MAYFCSDKNNQSLEAENELLSRSPPDFNRSKPFVERKGHRAFQDLLKGLRTTTYSNPVSNSSSIVAVQESN